VAINAHVDVDVNAAAYVNANAKKRNAKKRNANVKE